VLFRPEFDPAELHLCTAAMALAALEACHRVAGVEAVLKWPNDVLVGEAKLAGVLAEAEFEGGRPDRCAVVVGMGLNLDWPGPPGVGGTCLAQLSEAAVDRPALLNGLLEALSARRALLDSTAGRREVAGEMRDRCATLGRRVQVALASETIAGVAEEIDDAGQLVVRTPAGLRTVSAGDVVHLRPG
jgi:BirA family transcriptional regulator, biotin operon repressor / biotin---[acetyl-CoA-carboxylase] ligase